jgi:ribulose-5-phosphate 4-epimerase/fuculose-1-phosphate aldolase
VDGVPVKLNDISDQEWALRVDLACLFRINAHLGWEDSINTHSTMRVPGPEHHFLINPFGLRLGEVKASALVKIDLDGNVIGESPHPINRAGYVIHSAIHMGRTDAKCVIHTHSLPGMAVAAAAGGLIEHNIFALGFHGCLSYHDFEGASGDHNTSERKRLAASLGPSNKAMILRNHGLLSVGKTVAEAFMWMYRLDRACQVQVMANGAGGFAKPSEQAAAFSVKGAEDFATGFGACAPGALEFEAFRRLIDEIDPGYRD